MLVERGYDTLYAITVTQETSPSVQLNYNLIEVSAEAACENNKRGTIALAMAEQDGSDREVEGGAAQVG